MVSKSFFMIRQLGDTERMAPLPFAQRPQLAQLQLYESCCLPSTFLTTPELFDPLLGFSLLLACSQNVSLGLLGAFAGTLR